jgi:hypothetical protein
MHFTKALLFLSALAPVAFAAQAAEADCVTKTITLVPSGYTPPPSSTPTPTSTMTPISTPFSATPSLSRIASSSTPLVKPTGPVSGTEAPAATSSIPASGAASLHLPGAMAAGAAAIAGLFMI